MKGAGGGMLGKDWKGLVLWGLVGFWMVLGGFGAHAGPCWVRWVRVVSCGIVC